MTDKGVMMLLLLVETMMVMVVAGMMVAMTVWTTPVSPTACQDAACIGQRCSRPALEGRFCQAALPSPGHGMAWLSAMGPHEVMLQDSETAGTLVCLVQQSARVSTNPSISHFDYHPKP